MTNWGRLLRRALAMGLAPEAFWRLSVREWVWLTAGEPGARPLGRSELERLADQWPDDGSPSPTGEEEGGRHDQ